MIPFRTLDKDADRIPADASLIRRAHARGTLIAETLPERAALLDATYDGQIPPGALAALDAERARIRRLPPVEIERINLDSAHAHLARDARIFRAVMRERRAAIAALRVSRLPPNQAAFASKVADLSAEAKFSVKRVRNGRELVAQSLGRLAAAEWALALQAAE